MRYKYDVDKGVRQTKTSAKKYLVGGLAGVVIIAGSMGSAFAAGGPPGYDNNPGRAQATEVGAQCGTGAGSGAFGAFGEQGAYGHDFRGGANGPATGDANSAICGQGHNTP
jgi:hypothetical protein